MSESSYIEQMNRVADYAIAQQKLLDAAPEMLELLRELEHVKFPEMSFSRCPVCLSPLDLSEPHEQRCKLGALLARFPR
jgi:hypothetical protein